MANLPVLLALTTGAAAAFNPCGFTMLPAYLGAFVQSTSEDTTPKDAAFIQRSKSALIVRAAQAGGLVTGGFLLVFGIIGIIVSELSNSFLKVTPLVTIAIGLILVMIGVASISGRGPRLRIAGRRTQDAASNAGLTTNRGMFLYGVSYAVVSLGCTLPTFMGNVFSSFTQQRFFDAFVLYIAFALGMGLVVVSLSILVSLAQHGVVGRLRQALPWIQRITGTLMVLVGCYLAYYGWYEHRVLNRNADGDDAIVSATNRMTFALRDLFIGNGPIIMVAVVVLTGVVITAYFQARTASPRTKETVSTSQH